MLEGLRARWAFAFGEFEILNAAINADLFLLKLNWLVYVEGFDKLPCRALASVGHAQATRGVPALMGNWTAGHMTTSRYWLLCGLKPQLLHSLQLELCCVEHMVRLRRSQLSLRCCC
jgi:hypothetical protein